MGSAKPDGDKSRQDVATGAKCPICSAPTEAAFRPFCSRRCADVDLSRWLRGAYAVPGRADVDEDGDDTVAASNAGRTNVKPDDEDDD